VETLEEIKAVIYEMRQILMLLIEEKQNLLDAEVIAISQKLDCVLNKYNDCIKEQLVKTR
jgi:hypothetical protein